MGYSEDFFEADAGAAMLDGVEGGAGNAGRRSKLLLEDAELAAAGRELLAEGEQLGGITGGLTGFVAGCGVSGHGQTASGCR